MSKYYIGDIVEIVTAKYKSWEDIPQHERHYFENQNEYAHTIGQRFEVRVITNEGVLYAVINNRMQLRANPECVRLISRKFINRIKYLLNL